MTRIAKKTKAWGIWGLLQTPGEVFDYHSAFLGVFRIFSQAEAFCFYGALVPDPRAGVRPPLPNNLRFHTCTRACWGPKGHLSNPLHTLGRFAWRKKPQIRVGALDSCLGSISNSLCVLKDVPELSLHLLHFLLSVVAQFS